MTIFDQLVAEDAVALLQQFGRYAGELLFFSICILQYND